MPSNQHHNVRLARQSTRDALTETERVLACCTIAREKLEIGDYDGGCAVLAPWWQVGGWPNQTGMDQLAAGELLLVAGSLTTSQPMPFWTPLQLVSAGPDGICLH